MKAARLCLLCGVSISHRRADAKYCGGGCRAEASRLRAILAERGSGPYTTVASRMSALTRRMRRTLGLEPQEPVLKQPQPKKEKQMSVDERSTHDLAEAVKAAAKRHEAERRERGLQTYVVESVSPELGDLDLVKVIDVAGPIERSDVLPSRRRTSRSSTGG